VYDQEDKLKDFIVIFNQIFVIVFMLLYSYQFLYILIRLIKKRHVWPKAKNIHKFAFIVSARNESSVIGELIKSMKAQDYPKDKFEIFIVADNCTDNTAEVAREAGAIVYERFSETHKGKGFALDFLFNKIRQEHEDKNIEAYLVFDADNLLCRNYLEEMNKVYDSGYNVSTSYRNSKNFDSNWISAGYSIWFLRDSQLLNNVRMMLNSSSVVAGTGFMVSKHIIDEKGWKYFLMSEDTEFSVDCILSDEMIAYNPDAMFYDEQPTSFKQSWKQRMRWAKGTFQVFRKYGGKLFKEIFKGKFACYDMFMMLAPASILSILCIVVNGTVLLISLVGGEMFGWVFDIANKSFLETISGFYVTFLAYGIICTIFEWNRINADTFSKIIYTFTFPIFMFTYLPIAMVAIVKKVEWQQIEHSINVTIDDVNNNDTQ